MTKVNAKMKRQLTSQWQKFFPDFEGWRPLRLLRRIGPVLQGVTLDLTSSGDEYFPTAHVHALTMDFPVVSLSLDHRLADNSGRPTRLSVDEGDNAIAAAAESLRSQSPLPLDRYPTLTEVVNAYRSHVEEAPLSRHGVTPELESLVLVAAFSEDPRLLSAQLDYVSQLAESWRTVPEGHQTARAWVEQLAARATDRVALDALVEAQAKRLGVERLRSAPLTT